MTDHINNDLLDNIKKCVVNPFIVASILTAVIILYMESSIISNVIIYILHIIYNIFRLNRYLFIMMSGTGFDIVKYYCTDKNMYINYFYMKESAKHNSTTLYYDFCVQSEVTMLFLILYCTLLLCLVIVLTTIIMNIGTNILEYETRENYINRMYNEQLIIYNNIEVNRENETTGLISIEELKVLTKDQQVNILYSTIIVTHCVVSILNYAIRQILHTNDIFDIILVGIYICHMAIIKKLEISILISYTHFIQRKRDVEVELV